MDLLFEFGKRRYFSMARVWQRTSRLAIRGFSAGSYVGLALVHVLKEIKSVRTRSVLGAIACPPSFLTVHSDQHTVHLLHYPVGDHRQTPGGLRKCTARRFRQKLLRRPVALRGNSEKVQSNTLYKVVVRYLTGTPLSPAYPLTQLMQPDPLLPQNAHEQIEALAKELLGTYATGLTGIVPRTALTVLWFGHSQT